MASNSHSNQNLNMFFPGLRLKRQMAWLGMNWSGEEFLHHSLLQSSHIHSNHRKPIPTCGTSLGTRIGQAWSGLVRLGQRNKSVAPNPKETRLKNPSDLSGCHFSRPDMWKPLAEPFHLLLIANLGEPQSHVLHRQTQHHWKPLKMEALLGKLWGKSGCAWKISLISWYRLYSSLETPKTLY